MTERVSRLLQIKGIPRGNISGSVHALEEKGIKLCIPERKSRRKPAKYDKRKYKRHNRIEIMFGRLKDWRRVTTRYD